MKNTFLGAVAILVCLGGISSTRAQTGPMLRWDEDPSSIVKGFAVTMDGVRIDYFLTPIASDGTCGCAIAVPYSGGTHTFTVGAYNTFGETSTTYAAGPTAKAGGPYSTTLGSAVSVSAAGSTNPFGSIAQYAWSWGDGSSSTATSTAASHTYAAAGTFTVRLTVTDTAGGTATASTTATVAPAAGGPTAKAGGPYSAMLGSVIAVSAAGSTSPLGPLAQYAWLWGDGSSSTATSTTASHTYAAAGTFTIKLTVTDTAGGTASASTTATIATAGGSAVTGLTLIDADTDLPVAGFDPIPDGATIDLAALPTINLNLRANTSSAAIGSVRFQLDSTTSYRTDSAAPYALGGETGGNYSAWTLSLGPHTVIATPYTGSAASGTVGTPSTLSFFITRSRIHAGGAAYKDTAGKTWTPDAAFSGGSTSSTATGIAGTVEDPLYQTRRYGNFSYGVPVRNGTYAVTLHFAETYFTGAGKRVFNVTVEGQLAIDHLDIWAVAGTNAAMTRTVGTTVTDGILDLNFINIVNNAAVSAIEIAPLTGVNQAPVVNAGLDKVIALPATSVALTGSASDDKLPAPPGVLTYAWSAVSGPAGVGFSAPTALATTVTFTTTGTYTLRLTVSDSVLTAADDVIVTVNPASANRAPVVNAGVDKSITLPTSTVSLTGTASDDGLPAPQALTYSWSLVSGPATVNVSAAQALATTATFTTAGTYTLRLTVSDSLLSATDDVVVTVNPVSAFAAILINAGGPAYTGSTGQVWAADKNFTSGATASTSTAIAGTPDATPYRSERYGNFSYNIPVPAGNYAVTLYFAEIYWTGAGKRVFNVAIEGQSALQNFDIWALAGSNTAVTRTVSTTVTDGMLNIVFTTVANNAKVSAIQVAAIP